MAVRSGARCRARVRKFFTMRTLRSAAWAIFAARPARGQVPASSLRRSLWTMRIARGLFSSCTTLAGTRPHGSEFLHAARALPVDVVTALQHAGASVISRCSSWLADATCRARARAVYARCATAVSSTAISTPLARTTFGEERVLGQQQSSRRPDLDLPFDSVEIQQGFLSPAHVRIASQQKPDDRVPPGHRIRQSHSQVRYPVESGINSTFR